VGAVHITDRRPRRLTILPIDAPCRFVDVAFYIGVFSNFRAAFGSNLQRDRLKLGVVLVSGRY
jgi:hypothetical protein